MNVLVAFDRIASALSAYDASSIAQEVIARIRPNWQLNTTPLTDGGESFVRTMTRAYYGDYRPVPVLGPELQPQQTELGVVECKVLPPEIRTCLRLPRDGFLAIIEAALPCQSRVGNASRRSSFGVGKMISKAADDGAAAILMGCSKVSTLDLGLGALEAIGLELISEDHTRMSHVVPEMWPQVQRLAGEIWPHIPPIYMVAATDRPLLGPNGAVTIEGPDKGLKTEQLSDYERTFGGLSKKLCDFFDKPRKQLMERGMGEGGGMCFGISVACDAERLLATEFVPAWLNLEEQVDQADVIVAGCGRLDSHSLYGGNIGVILRMAKAAGKHTFVFASTAERGLKLPARMQLMEFDPRGTNTVDMQRRSAKLLASGISSVFNQ